MIKYLANGHINGNTDGGPLQKEKKTSLPHSKCPLTRHAIPSRFRRSAVISVEHRSDLSSLIPIVVTVEPILARFHCIEKANE